jgi:hypothetical protein
MLIASMEYHPFVRLAVDAGVVLPSPYQPGIDVWAFALKWPAGAHRQMADDAYPVVR